MIDMAQADRTLRRSDKPEPILTPRSIIMAARIMGYNSILDVPDNRVAEMHEMVRKVI